MSPLPAETKATHSARVEFFAPFKITYTAFKNVQQIEFKFDTTVKWIKSVRHVNFKTENLSCLDNFHSRCQKNFTQRGK